MLHREESEESVKDGGAYVLIDKQHVNANKLSALVDILGLPESQQANLRSVWASAGSQVLKKRVRIRHRDRLIGKCLLRNFAFLLRFALEKLCIARMMSTVFISRAEIGYRDRRRGSLMAPNEISGGKTWRTKLRTHLWRSEALCISERRSEPIRGFVSELTPREKNGENPNEIVVWASCANTIKPTSDSRIQQRKKQKQEKKHGTTQVSTRVKICPPLSDDVA